VRDAEHVDEIAIAYSTPLEEAEELAKQIKEIQKDTPILLARLGTTLGVHVGPGTLIVGYR
jgi:fatty acid-binding protein DegV